jgi:hypothetical protein
LLSSAWGAMCKKMVYYVKGDEELEKYDFIDGDYKIIDENRNADNQYYSLVCKNKMYKYNIRLKPFLLAYSRNIMGDIAYNNHFDEIIRVMCDNIVYKSNVQFDVKNMMLEDKTTGKITWHHNRKI